MSARNGVKPRKDDKKAGPSGVSRNDVFSMPEKYGLKNMLLPLNKAQLKIVAEIKMAMGGEDIIAFVPRDFADRDEAILATLKVSKISMEIEWEVFECMITLFVFDSE